MSVGMKKINRFFGKFASKVTEFTGSSWAFVTAVTIVIIWGLTGPMFHYSDTWQLVINTGTTIVTFLMVFLIQHTQNKDSIALQLKLDELLASKKGASNRLINTENLSEEKLEELRKYYTRLVEESEKEEDHTIRHSIEESNIEMAEEKAEKLKDESGREGAHEKKEKRNKDKNEKAGSE
jgi:low affinity Fe/Cu permease